MQAHVEVGVGGSLAEWHGRGVRGVVVADLESVGEYGTARVAVAWP